MSKTAPLHSPLSLQSFCSSSSFHWAAAHTKTPLAHHSIFHASKIQKHNLALMYVCTLVSRELVCRRGQTVVQIKFHRCPLEFLAGSMHFSCKRQDRHVLLSFQVAKQLHFPLGWPTARNASWHQRILPQDLTCTGHCGQYNGKTEHVQQSSMRHGAARCFLRPYMTSIGPQQPGSEAE